MNAASIGIARASRGLMEPRLAYYCRLSPHNIARENYVVIRYVPLPLNRARRAISRGFVFAIDVKCRTATRRKSDPGELICSYSLRHNSREAKSKRNGQLRDVGRIFRTCVFAEFRDTMNFAIHNGFVAMHVRVRVYNRCRQARTR